MNRSCTLVVGKGAGQRGSGVVVTSELREGQSGLNAYILCSTPRTGSTLLCELLTSTRVAGTPHSYFRSQDMATRASEWGLLDRGTFEYTAYLDAVRNRTATPNGIVGLRVMWGTLDEILGELRGHDDDRSDVAVLEAALGRLRFVHLYRHDVVGQAISLYRAEQTDYWHSTQPQEPKQAAAYDFREISERVDSLRNDHAAWREWFRSEDITQLSVSYEELDAEPVRTAAQVLEHLGLPTAVHTMSAPSRKLADETTRQWRERFVNESGAS